MANSLGALRVFLGLDAAEFTRGLTKAEYQTQQFARNTRTALLEIGKVLGTLEIGRQLYENAKAIIGEASALNDLSEATGSSVEALSRLNNQAKISGADFSTIEDAVLRLSSGMAGVETKGSKVNETLTLLGIASRDPAQALQEVALKLATYADGTNKVGLAQRLFGDSGRAFLKTLQDIADLQDVGATVTAKQAAEAENLEKAFRRLGVEASTLRNGILNEVVPSLTTLIQTFNDAKGAAGNFGTGLTATLSLLSRSGDDATQLRKVADEIANLKKQMAERTPFAAANAIADFFDMEALSKLEAERSVIEQRIRRANRAQIEKDAAAVFGPKPPAPNPPSADAKGTRERTSETDRYIASLYKQLQATLDLNEVDKANVAIYDLLAAGSKDLTAAKIDEIRDIATQIQYSKDAEKAAKDLAKAQEEIAKARERDMENRRHSLDTAQREIDSIRDAVEVTHEQIIAITQGQGALDAYIAAKREKVAVEKEDLAATYAAVGEVDLAQKYLDAAAAIRSLNAASSGLRIAEDIRKQAEAVQSLKSEAFDAVSRPIEDLIVNGGKASDVLKQLERNLVAFITNQAFLGIKNFALGGPGGGDLFSILLGSLGFGGGGGIGAGGISSGGLAGFATGGTPSSGFAMVGENGPELVQFSGRERVYSNADSKAMLGGSVSVHQTFNVTGQVDSRTARNMAREAAGAVAAARGRG